MGLLGYGWHKKEEMEKIFIFVCVTDIGIGAMHTTSLYIQEAFEAVITKKY